MKIKALVDLTVTEHGKERKIKKGETADLRPSVARREIDEKRAEAAK